MSINEISTMNDTELALFVAEARRRKMAVIKTEKYAKFEPEYSLYRNSLVVAKKANEEKKRLLEILRSKGFGAEDEAETTPSETTETVTPTVAETVTNEVTPTTVTPPPIPTTKKGSKK